MASSKKSFVLRLDESVYNALEAWAADEFRSVNGQLEFIIDRALKAAGRKKHPKEPTDTKGGEEEPMEP